MIDDMIFVENETLVKILDDKINTPKIARIIPYTEKGKELMNTELVNTDLYNTNYVSTEDYAIINNKTVSTLINPFFKISNIDEVMTYHYQKEHISENRYYQSRFLIFDKENLSIKFPFCTIDKVTGDKVWSFSYIVNPLGTINTELIKLIRNWDKNNLDEKDKLCLQYLETVNNVVDLVNYDVHALTSPISYLEKLYEEYAITSLMCKPIISIIRKRLDNNSITHLDRFWSIFQSTRMNKSENYNNYQYIKTEGSVLNLTFPNYLSVLDITTDKLETLVINSIEREKFIAEFRDEESYLPIIKYLTFFDFNDYDLLEEYKKLEETRMNLNRRIYTINISLLATLKKDTIIGGGKFNQILGLEKHSLDTINSQNFSWQLKDKRGRKTMIGSPMWG